MKEAYREKINFNDKQEIVSKSKIIIISLPPDKLTMCFVELQYFCSDDYRFAITFTNLDDLESNFCSKRYIYRILFNVLYSSAT